MARTKSAREPIEKEGGTVAFLRCDVSDEAQVEALVGATVSAFGNLDFASWPAGTVRRASTRSR
ncbi:SDR family oxidoreductase [Streptomyces sp. 2A115]|uniref:SDR family oxidoreductase n=1 Tax=Streptomyces sp. 2A115 TaxID=3457439 RepID=UPI003FD56D01